MDRRAFLAASAATAGLTAFPLTPVSATEPAAVDGHSDYGWNGQADQTLATLDPSVTLDLGRAFTDIDTLTYLPRQDTETPYSFERFITEGTITEYRVSAGVDGASFRTVAEGRWAPDHTLKQARFRTPTTARYIRLEALAAVGDGPGIASEVGCGAARTRPRPL
ncbi:discoidin domain-containing protein [Spirillospora sp. CA-128828]|uniref:discoidin domain-containing protein n=1 Tax=Spirillospora sp. CA-128828 TaxID=3240033 RepID=UPI003D8F3A5C